MKILSAGLFVSCALLAPALVHAQQPSDIELENAKNLFNQAQDAYNAGNYEQALKFYSAAYNLAKKPTILFNIGQCHRKLNHPKEASDSYKQFLKDDPNTPYKGEVEYKVAELEEQLGNKKEALAYYQLYMQHRLETDTNKAAAKERIAVLEKEISAAALEPVSQPIDDKTPAPNDGKLKKLIVPIAITSASFAGASTFGAISLFTTKKRNKCIADRVDDDANTNCELSTLQKDIKQVQVRSLTSDAFSLVAIGSAGYIVYKLLKKDPAETPRTTSLRLLPTSTGGLVTFSFTPQP